ncbi:hypothetical protein [Actinoplanes regularis]|uniref:hypothetical protein n=1 Tax=Actinoplanes regularis TaxID=52697 RepID=UPI0024A23616|nr:hypothetical protein [Actinoplanes regularis]GLW27429.1 hypothetical protein Areg01_03700 [Actinoplanes regularis]
MVTGPLLRIDPESVAAAGRDLAGVAQRMADDVAELETVVGGASGPWGGDEAGSVFALAYRAVVDVALEALGSYTEQVGFAAATLVLQARTVAAEDAENAVSLYAASGTAPSVATGPGSTAATSSGSTTAAGFGYAPATGPGSTAATSSGSTTAAGFGYAPATGFGSASAGGGV